MPAKLPFIAGDSVDILLALGQQIRAYRKALRISAAAASEAAGMSRVTLHRIENGEAAVTMGAYLNALTALNLKLGSAVPAELVEPQHTVDREEWIPARIRLNDYPQLKTLAWQVHGTETLTPTEVWDIYERNWRHLDLQSLALHERQLINALCLAFANGAHHV